MKKNLVLFSTHIINKAIISEYKKFLNIPDVDCVLVINNESLKAEPEYSMENTDSRDKYVVRKNFFGLNIPCLMFDAKLSQNMGLPNYYKNQKDVSFGWTMWYNGDYRLYYAKKFFPDYEYYWQIEYDVFMNGRSYEIFFDKYKNNQTDLIIPMFREETPHSGWGWNDNLEWLYGTDKPIYASFFPALRISNKALDFLYKRRLEVAEIFKNLEMTDETYWVFCETFVPTELMLNGFTCANMDEPNILLPMTEFDLSSDRIFEKPDNMLYHPVKGDFVKRIKSLKNVIKELEEKLAAVQNS